MYSEPGTEKRHSGENKATQNPGSPKSQGHELQVPWTTTAGKLVCGD